MKESDIVFKFYSEGERPDPDCFCYYGWEEPGAFAFWKYACAYYDSAEVLFEKFNTAKGDIATLDSIGLTICFLYRHYVELSVKYLYLKFGTNDKATVKSFLEKGHNLYELWQATKPALSTLRKRVGSTVSIGPLEHYILEFDKFDKSEQTMRYPIKKDLTAMNNSSRLDIINLHNRMIELNDAIERLSGDLENQLMISIEEERINAFEHKYEALREKILSFIDTMDTLAKKNNSEEEGDLDILDFFSKPNPKAEYMKKCSDDEIIMLDTLFYTGRMINCNELRLPKNPNEAKIDAIKMCIINMDNFELEFGKPINEMINIWDKSCDALCNNIKKAVTVIDQDSYKV